MTIESLFTRPPATPGERAARHLYDRHRELAQMAREATADGWTHWADELREFAGIAFFAARAEARPEGKRP